MALGRRFSALLVALAALLAGCATQTPTLVIEHVTIVDVEAGSLEPDRTVRIEGNRIASITAASRAPRSSSARTISGRGKFLIPGLWDLHTHVWNDSATAAIASRVLIANGVTGIRDMAGPLDRIVAWRDSIRAGSMLGPRAFVAGPVIDGPPPATDGDVLVRTPEEARHAVDSLVHAGVDFIKAYEMLREDAFRALVAEAHRRGVPVAGHLPLAMDAFEASSLGMVSFEHLRNLELAGAANAESLRLARIAMLDSGLAEPGRALRARIHSAQRPFALANQDTARDQALLRALARNGTWQVPTLFLDQVALALVDSSALAEMRTIQPYVPSDYRTWWDEQVAAFQRAPPESRERAYRYARWLQGYVRRLQRAGVGLLAGTDAPNLLTALGFSLHQELRALRDAGLSDLEALRTATLNPARFFDQSDILGSVRAEKLADLVILDADPLRDIENTRRIHAVIVDGRLLTRSELDEMLEEVRRSVAAP